MGGQGVIFIIFRCPEQVHSNIPELKSSWPPRVFHSGLETRKTICVHRSNQDPGIVFRFPINLLSIQVFVIIIEKGVKGFTLLKVIPLAYASYGMWQGSRYDLDIQFKIGTCFTPSSNVRPQWQSNIADHVWRVKQASFEISQRRPCIPFISVYRKRPSVKPGFELLKLVQVH